MSIITFYDHLWYLHIKIMGKLDIGVSKYQKTDRVTQYRVTLWPLATAKYLKIKVNILMLSTTIVQNNIAINT